AGGDVAGGARTEADDHAHRPRWIGLRFGDPGSCGETGSARGQRQKSTTRKRHGMTTPSDNRSTRAQHRLFDGLRQYGRAQEDFWTEMIIARSSTVEPLVSAGASHKATHQIKASD